MREIGPEAGLSSPAFYDQAPGHPDQDNPHVGLNVCTGHDQQRHDCKDADQQPVQLHPEWNGWVKVGNIFFDHWPPDNDDERDYQNEGAHQVVAGMRPFQALEPAQRCFFIGCSLFDFYPPDVSPVAGFSVSVLDSLSSIVRSSAIGEFSND